MTARVLLDACVLVPGLTRALLFGAADAGLFTPLWSREILAEWQHAADRQGPQVGAETRIEQALLPTRYPTARITLSESMTKSLDLPDENDRHVLAAAIEGKAAELLTANISDFPLRTLGQYGILRRHPDEFLLELARTAPKIMLPLAETALSTTTQSPRKLFQRSGLNRFAKHISGHLG